MTEDERKTTWYGTKERSVMKKRACRTAVITASANQECLAKLNASYRDSRFLSAVLDDHGLENFLKNPTGVTKYRKNLDEWCQSEAARGLELWASDVHRAGRDEIAREARKVVIETSKYLRNVSLSTADVEGMAREYRNICRSATVLARLLAEGDAIAVVSESNMCPPNPKAHRDICLSARIEV